MFLYRATRPLLGAQSVLPSALRCLSYTAPIVVKPIKKLLVANRGEIAIRVMRTCHELGIKTVGIYSHEDRFGLHRMKADESYQVGVPGKPMDAYLDMQGIINIAKMSGTDAIHPGYGFNSEKADFAELCNKNGIVFVGPTPTAMALMGDKTEARKLARECKVPIIPGTETMLESVEEAKAYCKDIGFPVILKAAHGGGGRGMRVVNREEDLAENFRLANEEAKIAFGNGSIFIERYVTRPRHVEVQVMADTAGNAVHFFERDCSVQRRHQKVIETAPAPGLDPAMRQRLFDDALKLVRKSKYRNAGTCEFLLDRQGRHYFIEVNARLQVEHPVTEEITGVDLVQTQIRVAEGKTLPELGLTQDKIKCLGHSVQCRVTTEDPANNFAPSTGKIIAWREGQGMGIRLDVGNGFPGSVIGGHYDSLLCKLIGRSNYTHADVCTKLTRALQEFRIRGVKTNIPFLINTINHPRFRSGQIDTSLIGDNPELFDFSKFKVQDRADKILQYLGTLAVNGPQTPLGTSIQPLRVAAPVPPTPEPETPATGWRDVLLKEGPTGFAKAVREKKGVLITDTTFRDGHQSLLATRVRTFDLARIAPYASKLLAPAYSMEMWGGATFDVALNFLRECPWERVRILRELIPNVPFQMLLRGANAVGYASYPDNVVKQFCKLASKAGIDIFRVFDSLNYLPNLQIGMEAAGEAGGVVEAAMCYTDDLSDPNGDPKYNLDYYLKLADKLVRGGAHVLAIKDMSGILKPQAATILVSALRKEFPNVPIHIHTHDTAGAAVATHIAAARAGADVLDVAVDTISGMTSQPSMGALVYSLERSEHDTGINPDLIHPYSTFWELTRGQYGPFECTSTMKSGSSYVYKHQIPGGQYTNLQFQAYAIGIADKFDKIIQSYITANRVLGNIIKVTPSSKVVGDLAQFMVSNNLTDEKSLLARAKDLSFPESVKQFFAGEIGHPHFELPAQLSEDVLKGKPVMHGRPGATLAPVNLVAKKQELQTTYPTFTITDEDVISSSLYPQVFKEYMNFRTKYGDVSGLPTKNYFVAPVAGEEIACDVQKGKTLLIKFIGVGDLDAKTGQREVFFELNGQPRNVVVRDEKKVKEMNIRPKKDMSDKCQVGAPMPARITKVAVKDGDKIKKGGVICTLYAMKMNIDVTSPHDGVVEKLSLKQDDEVQQDDFLCLVKAPK